VQHEYAATSRVQHEADRRASADVTNSPILSFAALAESFLDAEQRIAERRYFYTSRRRLDNVKQDGRFTDNHLGRSTGLIVGGYSAMFVAPSF
jgi:hypothetical protein